MGLPPAQDVAQPTGDAPQTTNVEGQNQTPGKGLEQTGEKAEGKEPGLEGLDDLTKDDDKKSDEKKHETKDKPKKAGSGMFYAGLILLAVAAAAVYFFMNKSDVEDEADASLNQAENMV